MLKFPKFTIPSVVVYVLLIFSTLGPLSTLGYTQDYRGHHGQGHDHWHGEFYNQLINPTTKQSCCSLNDCVPTQMRIHEGKYQVMVEGEWADVPQSQVVKKTAPDAGTHVCFHKATKNILCVVLPPET